MSELGRLLRKYPEDLTEQVQSLGCGARCSSCPNPDRFGSVDTQRSACLRGAAAYVGVTLNDQTVDALRELEAR